MVKAKIMLVEDEALLAADLSDNLKEIGYEVVYLHSGEAALEKFEAIAPDIVLMDIKLKGKLDGIQTAEKLLAERPVAIVFLTAYADDELIRRARISEPFGYLVKPVTIKMLHTTIEIALYKSRIEQERNALLSKLQRAREEINTLRRFLPICASCKKVRQDEGYWKEIEEYITENIKVNISHGICPACVKKLYPDLYDDADSKK